MPEGDTIFRAARTLNRALAGHVVTRFETQLPQLSRIDEDHPIAGRTIERVDATGKWMRIWFSGDLLLLTHMLMSGSWHIYRPGEAWQQPRIRMRVAIHTADFVAVAFQVPIAEFHTAESLSRHRSVQNLGPDVLASDFDEETAAARLRENPSVEIGEALLQQSIVSGLGNVFKSEVCFAAGVNPFDPVKKLSDSQLLSLMHHARRFLQSNVTDASGGKIVTYTGPRRTTGRVNESERLWVYKRAGEPCRNCGTPILSRKQGIYARVIFWCPRCQGIS